MTTTSKRRCLKIQNGGEGNELSFIRFASWKGFNGIQASICTGPASSTLTSVSFHTGCWDEKRAEFEKKTLSGQAIVLVCTCQLCLVCMPHFSCLLCCVSPLWSSCALTSLCSSLLCYVLCTCIRGIRKKCSLSGSLRLKTVSSFSPSSVLSLSLSLMHTGPCFD